jgi:hypothetical protein
MISPEPLSGTNAREIIKSLDAGTVPARGFERFSAGRERWLRSVATDLEDCSSQESSCGRFRVVNGRNGDGKTHLLHMVRALALTMGYPVAYVTVSADLPLHRWDRVYGEIARKVETPAGRVGVRDIFSPSDPDPMIASAFREKALAVRSIPRIQPDFANALLRYATAQTSGVDPAQELFALVAWLEGYPAGNLRPLGVNAKIDRTNGSNIVSSLLASMRHFGFPGLMVIVDEVESTMSLPKRQREESYQTLRLLVDGTTTPRHGIFVASTTPSMYSDATTGLPSYPALWSRLKPDDSGRNVDYDATIIDLTRTPLLKSDFETIGSAIVAIYSIAKDTDLPLHVIAPYIEGLAKEASQGNLTLTFSATRVFVKAIVNLLNTFSSPDGVPDNLESARSAFALADKDLGG